MVGKKLKESRFTLKNRDGFRILQIYELFGTFNVVATNDYGEYVWGRDYDPAKGYWSGGDYSNNLNDIRKSISGRLAVDNIGVGDLRDCKDVPIKKTGRALAPIRSNNYAVSVWDRDRGWYRQSNPKTYQQAKTDAPIDANYRIYDSKGYLVETNTSRMPFRAKRSNVPRIAWRKTR